MRATILVRCAALAVVVAATASCGDVIRSSRSPVMLVVNSVTGGATTAGTYSSDVLTMRTTPAPCSAASPCPTILNDAGVASLAVIMKDVTISPTTNNDVTITGYRVEYRRADGRNTPGVDVPFPFDGAVTGTVPAGGSGSVGFELVRHAAKLEAPLVQLVINLEVINVIAEVTFFGHDRVGNELSASGNIFIAFANHGG